MFNGNVSSILLSTLEQLLFSRFGAVLAVIVAAGLSIVALYFASARFRYAYNLFIGPSGRQARYRYIKGQKGLQVVRAGYAFDEEDGRWRYVNRSQHYTSKPRTYTKYYKSDN